MADEAAQVLSRSHQVDALLTRKDKVGALNVSLQNPPVNADKTVKVKNSPFSFSFSIIIYIFLLDPEC